MKKSGAWYTYESDQLGQGKENARTFLKDNPDLSDDIEKRIKEHMGIGPQVDAPAEAPSTPAAASRRAESAAAAKRPAAVSIDS